LNPKRHMKVNSASYLLVSEEGENIYLNWIIRSFGGATILLSHKYLHQRNYFTQQA